MARRRTIEEADFKDDRLAPAAPRTCLVWLGIRTLADDRGVVHAYMRDIVRRLPMLGNNIGPCIDDLLALGVIRQFEVEGKTYWALGDFALRQAPERPSYRYPLPVELWDYVGWTELLQSKARPVRGLERQRGRRRQRGYDIQPELDVGAAANGSPEPVSYAWQGKILRLTQRHYDRWRGDFAAIPDFKGALRSCDEWLQYEFREKPGGQWWMAARAYMAKRHQEWAAKQRGASPAPNSTAALVQRITKGV